MNPGFVHLHLHSEYSIVDGIIRIKSLCEEVKRQNMPAVALTDICNFFGMVKFYKEAVSQGIKPLIGSEFWVENEDKANPYHKVVLLCQNKTGYQHLSLLISKAYQFGEHLNVPLVKKSWIFENTKGLIALSGAQFGEVGQALVHGSLQNAKEHLTEWMNYFPNRYYLEIQRNQRPHEKTYNEAVVPLAINLNCPLVATNEPVFLKKEDFDAHKARVCIQEGSTLEGYKGTTYTPWQYFRTTEEMQDLFQDLPTALSNTVEIAKRCSLSLALFQPVLPSFPVPAGFTEKTYLQKASFEGLSERLAFKLRQKTTTQRDGSLIKQKYEDRLYNELSVINEMGFSGYFLIVADFIQWAKAKKIPVGPGRGSGAGSLVAYALAITDLDPIEYDLLFERFLNPERVSMPDFDIDFCMDNRDNVIDYVATRYGRHAVSQIATFGTMAAKAAVRDVGRVLGHPYGFVDKIAKLIPFEIGITLEKALEQEQALQKRYQEEEEVRNLIDLAKKLEGITRNVGKHAGGIVIAPSTLTDYAPFFCEKSSTNVVIQFDKDDVEAIGLTKFDFLGLKTLTIIDWAVQNVNAILKEQHQSPIDIQFIPLDDPKTFELLKKCATTAVFQLESRAMKELIKRLQPDHFEEIIALVALIRPGPSQSGMVDDFINRKHGRAIVEYAHEAIVSILKPTYGVILYQEQVMQIAQTLAGYTLGGADLLRRAMGKKKAEEMAKQRTIFIKGAISRKVDEKIASHIFDLMEKFAGYGFNKSHSAAYALVSYQTAWLKAHYPSAFMAAVLSADMSHTDKIVTLIEECKQCNIKVLAPNIQKSLYRFTVIQEDEILYGLGAIKGMGESAIEHIIAKRKERPFRDFFDFCERVDNAKVNKRIITALIKSGALDCFAQRAVLMAELDEALLRAEQLGKNLSYGQVDLFSQELTLSNKPVTPWSFDERLQAEKEALGMYFSGHPLSAVEPELTKLRVVKIKQIVIKGKDQKVFVAGLVVGLRSLQTKNGDRMAIVTLDDSQGRFEVAVFPDQYQKYRELLIKDQLIIIESIANHDSFSGGLKIRAQVIYLLSQARATFAKKMTIILSNNASIEKLNLLKNYLMLQERGNCPIYFEYQGLNAFAKIKLDNKWNIKLSQNTLLGLEDFHKEVALEYE